MQERRTTIRVTTACRAAYCPATDPTPRDGHVLNLSGGGAGLRLREAQPVGERLTVSFSLPGDDQPVTATGIVRWSDAPAKQRWLRAGLEWSPWEETARHRFQRFLYQQTLPSRAPAEGATPFRARSCSRVMGGLLGAALLGSVLMGIWRGVRDEADRRLQVIAAERDAVIHQLAQQDTTMRQELGAAQAYLASTVGEVTRLDRQAKLLEGQVQLLNSDVAAFEDSYAILLQERERLARQIQELQDEREAEATRAAFADQVRLAVHEAIESRRTVQRRAFLESLWTTTDQPTPPRGRRRGSLARQQE